MVPLRCKSHHSNLHEDLLKGLLWDLKSRMTFSQQGLCQAWRGVAPTRLPLNFLSGASGGFSHVRCCPLPRGFLLPSRYSSRPSSACFSHSQKSRFCPSEHLSQRVISVLTAIFLHETPRFGPGRAVLVWATAGALAPRPGHRSSLLPESTAAEPGWVRPPGLLLAPRTYR